MYGEEQISFLRTKNYLVEGETLEDRIESIVNVVRKHEYKYSEGLANRIKSMIENQILSLSTPQWANMGRESEGKTTPLPVSCNIISYPDSIAGIYYSHGEAGMLSKLGAGVGASFLNVSDKHTELEEGFYSNPKLDWIEDFVGTTQKVSQGCYDEETEVLTNKGWKYFREVMLNRDLKVAQVLDNEVVEFVKPTAYFEYSVKENLILFKDSKNINLLVTKNHNMVYKQEKKTIKDGKYLREVKDKWYTKTAEECSLHRDVKYLNSGYSKNGNSLTMEERLLIAHQADGSKVKNCNNAIRFRFSKVRKYERIKWILDELGLDYSDNFYEKDKTYNIYVNVGEVLPKTLSWVSIEGKSQQWCEEFLKEISFWDGSIVNDKNSFTYSSILKYNSDIVQQVASVSGYKSSLVSRDREKEYRTDLHTIYISKGNYFGVEKLNKQEVYYEGKVYCVEVPTHRLIVRRGGKTVVCGNSKRRGYGVPFISIDDPEFYDMMKRIDKTNPDKHDPLVENNVGIVLPVGFIERVKSGDKEAQKRILLVLEERKETGKVYLVNLENMNKNSSKVYEILGHFVDSTNICCVTGDQLVPTEFGYKTVEELSDCKKELNLFDNEAVYKSSQMLYRGYANVYKVELENGMSHKITSNHDLVVRDTNRKKYKKSIDNGLKIGDKVCFQTEKGLFGKRNEPKIAFLAGLYMGDGTKTSKNSIRLSLWENDFDLIEEIEKTCKDFYNRDYIIKHKNSKLPVFKKGFSGDSNVKRLDIDTSIFNTNGFEFEKDVIPHWILDSDEETQWQFLRGLLYADGTAGEYNKGKSFGNPITVSLASIKEGLLNKLQIVFANMGLNFKKHILRSYSKMMLPKNNGTNDYGEYVTKPIYRLILSNKNDLIELENKTKFLSRKGINIEKKKFRDNSKKSSKIINITKEGKEHVYCPTVDSEKHLWICNGIITSNTEVITPSYDDKTFACVIASLNAVKWDIIKENPQMIIDAYMFLDIVVEEYIELTEGIPFLEKARRSAIEKRDIGLGLLGFHELLQMNNLSFGGLGSKMLNIEIFSTMREYGEIATKQMAEKLGSPKMCEEAGLVRRNVSLMMVAPNKSCATPDTKFISEDDSIIDYYDFCKKGGIDIDEMMSVTLHLENGEVVKLKHDSKVVVIRDGVEITKDVKFLVEGDDILSYE